MVMVHSDCTRARVLPYVYDMFMNGLRTYGV